MKVSFLVSSQSILKRLSQHFETIIILPFSNNPENFAKFHLYSVTGRNEAIIVGFKEFFVLNDTFITCSFSMSPVMKKGSG